MTAYEINVKENDVWKYYTTVHTISEICSMMKEIESCKEYSSYNVIEIRRNKLFTRDIEILEGNTYTNLPITVFGK